MLLEDYGFQKIENTLHYACPNKNFKFPINE